MSGTLREHFDFLYGQNTPGKSIDKYFQATDVAKYIDRGLLLFKLTAVEHLLHMSVGADHELAIKIGHQHVSGALYTDLAAFSVSRLYYIENQSDSAKFLRGNGLNIETPSDKEFPLLIKERGWKERLEQHLDTRRERIKDYEKLHSRRIQNTTTNSTFVLNTKGCLICDEAAQVIASTTFAIEGESAQLMAVRLCERHMEAARTEGSLVNYLAKSFELQIGIKALDRLPKEVLEDGEAIMQSKLAMVVFDRKTEDIKGKTQKGTILIYRYESELDYGYMINSSDHKPLARIDSANHHPVEVGPDHLHPDLRKKAQPVSSFTTGDLCLDWPFIQRLISQWEAT